MNSKKYSIVIFLQIFLCLNIHLSAQVEMDSELFISLSANDSLLFERGYNNCEVQYMDSLIHEDFEFYHDKGGLMTDKADFVMSIKEGLCGLPYKARRKLIEGSMEVFPLSSNGELYGAIQKGEHQFYAKYPDKDEELTSIAKFTHVWLIVDGKWRFSRGLSYDHQSP